jgi:uncharacterized protein YciI
MYALVLIRYEKPLEEVAKHTDAHRAWLKQWNQRGIVLASGPFVPRTGGGLLVRAPDEATIHQLRDGDPFVIEGMASYEIKVWAPTMGLEALDKM